MDYEKKYNEAVCNIQKLLENGRKEGEVICAYEADLMSIFPELKENESEDEKIRKRLIEYFKDFRLGTFAYLEPKKIIAWLEKQGEPKHQYKSRPRYVGEEELLVANKQGEQKPAENEELTEFDKAVGVSIGTWNPKSPEQIQSVKAVSKKLLKLAKKQINDEQKPAEWSEEDEANFQCALSYVNSNPLLEDVNVENCRTWIKSLKYRIQPQDRWKPSDEQMKALDIAIRAGIQLGSWEEKALRELQKQLKAL